jgi:Lrp/AsnC family leucine-responsive transcriptional regulator
MFAKTYCVQDKFAVFWQKIRLLSGYFEKHNYEGGRAMEKSGREEYQLDETGWRILEELQLNARIPFRQLGKKVNLSPSAVIERVKRMEDEGIIEGYGVRINPRKAGYAMSALLSISTSHEKASVIIAEAIEDVPEVVSSWSITGVTDHILEVRLPSLEFLEKLLSRLSRIGHVTTHIVLPSFSKKSGLRILTSPREEL